jgi:hypothetical protein
MYPSMLLFLPPNAMIVSFPLVVKNVVCRPTVRPCVSAQLVVLSAVLQRPLEAPFESTPMKSAPSLPRNAVVIGCDASSVGPTFQKRCQCGR